MTNEQRILNALIGARQMLSSLDKDNDSDDLWNAAIKDIESNMGEPMDDSEFRMTAVLIMDTLHESIMELVDRFAHEEATAIREMIMKQKMHERRN